MYKRIWGWREGLYIIGYDGVEGLRIRGYGGGEKVLV